MAAIGAVRSRPEAAGTWGYGVNVAALYKIKPDQLLVALIIRDEQIYTPSEAEPVVAGDYVYLLAPPETAAVRAHATTCPSCRNIKSMSL